MDSKQYIVLPGQSMYDVVILNHGTVDAIMGFMALNPGFDINTQLVGGQAVNVATNYPGTNTSRRVVDFIAAKPLKPATQANNNNTVDNRITEDGEDRLTENNLNRITN